MKRILIVNGPNLNMLGIREKNIYGTSSYKDLVRFLKHISKDLSLKIKVKQSNIEGKLVTIIQKAYKKYDYIVINPGAYTHTSIAILDALKAVNIKTIEVHLSNINEREDFRKIDYIHDYCLKTFMGKGFESYKEALEYIKNN